MKVALALLLIVPCCLAKNFGGINVEGVGQVYVVGSDWNSDFVQVSSNELRLNGGGRIYFAKDASDGVYPELYWQVSLGLVLRNLDLRVMAIRVMEISNEGTKLERFLPKNQHTQRKLLSFENWISGGLRSFQKSELEIIFFSSSRSSN